MNKRQRKKRWVLNRTWKITRWTVRDNFIYFQDYINKDFPKVTHKETLQDLYTFGYTKEVRLAMKKIAFINNKQRGYHRYTKWNNNKLKSKFY